jgi:hypothetical protein
MSASFVRGAQSSMSAARRSANSLRFALAMGSGGQRAYRIRYVQPVRFLTSRQHQQGQDQSIYRLAHSPD